MALSHGHSGDRVAPATSGSKGNNLLLRGGTGR